MLSNIIISVASSLFVICKLYGYETWDTPHNMEPWQFFESLIQLYEEEFILSVSAQHTVTEQLLPCKFILIQSWQRTIVAIPISISELFCYFIVSEIIIAAVDKLFSRKWMQGRMKNPEPD